MKDKKISKDFSDAGNIYTVTIDSLEEKEINLPKRKYKLQSPVDNKYKTVKKKGIFTTDIGVKSSGFAPVFTLAAIIAIAGAIIAYLLWRF